MKAVSRTKAEYTDRGSSTAEILILSSTLLVIVTMAIPNFEKAVSKFQKTQYASSLNNSSFPPPLIRKKGNILTVGGVGQVNLK